MTIVAICSSGQALIVSSSLCNVVSLAMVGEETESQEIGSAGDSLVDMLRGKVRSSPTGLQSVMTCFLNIIAQQTALKTVCKMVL